VSHVDSNDIAFTSNSILIPN